MGILDGIAHWMNPGNRGGIDTTRPGTVTPPRPPPPGPPPRRDMGDTPADPTKTRSGVDWTRYQGGNTPGYQGEGGWSLDPNTQQGVRDSQQDFYNTQTFNQRFMDFAQPYFADYNLDKSARQRALDRARGDTSAQSSLFDAQGGHLQSNYDLANRDIDLKMAAQGIDRAQAEAELAALGPQRGLAADILHNQSSQAANQIAGFTLQDKDRRRAIESASVAAGTFRFPGQVEDLRSSHQNLLNQTEGANLSYEDAKLGYQGKLLDLESRRQEIDTREKKLDMVAQETGIDRDRAREALDFGLKQLGYDRYINANKLLDMIDSTSVEERNAANKVLTTTVDMFKVVDQGYVGNELKKFGLGMGR